MSVEIAVLKFINGVSYVNIYIQLPSHTLCTIDVPSLISNEKFCIGDCSVTEDFIIECCRQSLHMPSQYLLICVDIKKMNRN